MCKRNWTHPHITTSSCLPLFSSTFPSSLFHCFQRFHLTNNIPHVFLGYAPTCQRLDLAMHLTPQRHPPRPLYPTTVLDAMHNEWGLDKESGAPHRNPSPFVGHPFQHPSTFSPRWSLHNDIPRVLIYFDSSCESEIGWAEGTSTMVAISCRRVR